MKRIGIIGFGNMGRACVDAVLAQDEAEAEELRLHICESDPTKQAELERNYGEYLLAAGSDLELIILAVKPQVLVAVLAEYAELFEQNPQASIVSIAAGVSLERLEAMLPERALVRFMPNLAAQFGRSVTAVAYSARCGERDRLRAVWLAESLGLVLEVPEALIAAHIGVSGSGIAFVYEFVHALALGGTREGLSYADSLNAVLHTMEGAVASLRGTGLSPSEFVTRVCSPGGTTIEGVQRLHAGGFTATVMEAVSAAARKSRELEKKFELH